MRTTLVRILLAVSVVLASAISVGHWTAAASGPEVITQDILDPRDFGAKFDGSTNDSPAFAATVAALPANGGIIYLPPGTSKQNSTWVLNKTVRVMGSGAGTENGNAGVTRLLFGPGVTGISVTKFWAHLSDFFVESQSTVAGSYNGIQFRGASQSALENVFVYKFGQDCFNFDSSGSVNNNLISLSNTRALSCKRDGYNITGGLDINQLTFSGTDGFGCGRYGYYDAGNKNTFLNPHASANVVYDYLVAGSTGYFLTPYSESSGVAFFASGSNWNVWQQPGAYAKSNVQFADGAAQSANLVAQDFGWRGPTGVRVLDYDGTNQWRLASGNIGEVAFSRVTGGFQNIWRVLHSDAIFRVVSDLKIETAGKGLQVKEGTNAKMGTAPLVNGTVVVSTTAITAVSRIFLTIQAPGGTGGVGSVYVSTRSPGTSFTIRSTVSTDSSSVAWMIVEPA